jgi:Tfp pilus assembly PilM family ATPase
MLTAIEIASRTIRLCQIHERRVVALETFPVPADMDPIDVLQSVPLPGGITKVRVVVHNEDVLVRALVQPLCDPERLDRVVRFELGNSAGAEPVLFSWRRINNLTEGEDIRVLAVVAKARFVARLRNALKHHGVAVAAIQHPAVALYQVWRARGYNEKETCLLADVGGSQIHLAMVHEGELVFVRSQSPGMDELVKQVAALRGITEADAAALVSQVGKNMPGDLQELIRKHVSSLSSALSANVRFARAQLQVERIEPTSIWLSGSGARVHSLAECLREQMRIPVRIVNPFAGMPLAVPGERLDRIAALPSPWSPVIGAAHGENLFLDVLEDERRARLHQLTTMGALRIAAAAVAALLVLAVVLQEFSIWHAQGVIDDLIKGDGTKPGMVAEADKLNKTVEELSQGIAQAAERMSWLDKERRPGRVAVEILAAVDASRNPEDCKVVLQKYLVHRQDHSGTSNNKMDIGVRVELIGYAETGIKRSTDAALRAFERALVKGYPPITGVSQLPAGATVSTRQQFRWILTIADQPMIEKSREAEVINNKRGLALKVIAPPGVSDLDAVAHVAALRARTTEAFVKVSVIPSGGSDADAVDVAPIAFKD